MRFLSGSTVRSPYLISCTPTPIQYHTITVAPIFPNLIFFIWLVSYLCCHPSVMPPPPPQQQQHQPPPEAPTSPVMTSTPQLSSGTNLVARTASPTAERSSLDDSFGLPSSSIPSPQRPVPHSQSSQGMASGITLPVHLSHHVHGQQHHQPPLTNTNNATAFSVQTSDDDSDPQQRYFPSRARTKTGSHSDDPYSLDEGLISPTSTYPGSNNALPLRNPKFTPPGSATDVSSLYLSEKQRVVGNNVRALSRPALGGQSKLAAWYSKFNDSAAYWLILYFMFNLGLTLFNKIVLVNFPFPYTLTGLHALSGSAGCYLALEKGAFVPARLTSKENMIMAAFSVLYTINIAVSNLSLHLVTVPVSSVPIQF